MNNFIISYNLQQRVHFNNFLLACNCSLRDNFGENLFEIDKSRIIMNQTEERGKKKIPELHQLILRFV